MKEAVIKTEKLSDGTILFELKFPEKANFTFKAGQFILVYQKLNEKEENRAFSLASKPSQKTIELLIRVYEQGKVSPKIAQLKAGEKLKIRGPFGMFTLKNTKEEIIFIAVGTGIAPFRSMIHEALEKNQEKKITLIFGFRYEHDFFFQEEFKQLEKKHKNFHLYPCATQPTETWVYDKGRVTNILPEVIKNSEHEEIYICGPKQMINDTLDILIKQLNFKKEDVHIERWGA